MAIKSDSYLGSLFGLEGKTIVVTGAGGGIGLAISGGLRRAGGVLSYCASGSNSWEMGTPSTWDSPYSSMSVTVRCRSSIRDTEPRHT